jgi:hypothetical protein
MFSTIDQIEIEVATFQHGFMVRDVIFHAIGEVNARVSAA